MRRKWAQFVLIGLLLAVLCIIVIQVAPTASISSSISYIGENDDDVNLLSSIKEKLNSTGEITDIRTSENLNDLFLNQRIFDSYSIIVLSMSQVSHPFNDSLIADLNDFIGRGGTFIIISSQIWKFPSSFHDIFELQIEEVSLKEWPVGNASTDISLRIINDSFTRSPYEFNFNQSFNIVGRIGVANTTNIKFTLADSTYTPEGKTSINAFSKKSGFVAAVPLSVENVNDSIEVFSQFLTSLLSTEAIPGTLLPSSSPIFPLLQVSEETVEIIVGASLLITTISLVIYGTREVIKTIRIPDTTKVVPDRNLLYSIFIAPFILIGHVLYPPIIRRLDEDMVIENETRMKIIDCLMEREFLHFRELKRELSIGTSSLKWHLRVLEDFGIIHHRKVGQYEIFFLLRKMPNTEFLDIYFAIISGVGFRVAKAFHEMKSWNIEHLAEYLGSSKEAIRYHLKKLEQIDLIHSPDQEKYNLNPRKLNFLHEAINRRNKTN